MSGQGPAADTKGNIYFVTGNGTFDGVVDFGESICRAKYTPGTPAKLEIVDWFTPFADSIRDDGSADTDAPTNSKSNDWYDQDLGSSGIVLLEEHNLALTAGKDGIAYVVKMDNMGKTTEHQVSSGGNFAALASPPEWFTYFPGFDKSPMPSNTDDLNFQFNGHDYAMHSTAVHYKAAGKDYVYCWAGNGNLRAWSIDASGKLAYLACGAEVAASPGGMLIASANSSDTNSGIIWACLPYKDAGEFISPGRLIAYDAANFGQYSDGSGAIKKLWDSQDWGINFTHNKFNLPVVSGGKVFVPTYSGTIEVFGLTK
jgi:hypothetical protein